jgi:AcrR family transcriptional regulator
MRNAELTKHRILEAATEEFSRYGFAGARVDRIAQSAGANKALIYAYFGNKEKLFAEVYQAIIGLVVQDVTLDPADLPGYLERRIDWQLQHPALPRISLWGALEVPEFRATEAMREGRMRKEAILAQGQADGVISTRFAPGELLDLLDALANPAVTLDPARAEQAEAYKHAAVAALRRLIEPEP